MSELMKRAQEWLSRSREARRAHQDDAGRLLEDPAEYQGEEAIRVACTQLDDASRQRKLVSAWGKALPDLRRIEFVTRFPQRLLEPLSECSSLVDVRIEWSGLKSIAALKNLPHLETLFVGSSPAIADPESVLTFPALRRLRLEHVRSLYDIGWISDMHALEVLYLEGSMWSRQKLLSLSPLKSLDRLQHLGLASTLVTETESLWVLAAMPALRSFNTAWYWPKGMLTRLAKARPDLTINDRRWPDFKEFDKNEWLKRF